MSGKFIVPIQLPLLESKPDTNPAEGYYKLYLRDNKLRKMDWLGIEQEIGSADITTTQIANWDEAYSWGNHADAGYVTLSTDQEIFGQKIFQTHQYFNAGFTVNDGNVKFYKAGRTQALVDIDHDLGRILYRYNDILTSSTSPSLIAHLFTNDQGFSRVDHYGSFQGTYDVGHQYNFWYGNTTSTAGLWNINFLGGTITNRPLMTINNGAGAGILNTPVFKLMSNGNLLLGFSTDSGQKLQVNGSVKATSYIVTSGTSSQFLKADGTLDSNTYLTTGGASGAYVSLSGSYANPSWITSLAYSKITGVPAFLTAEADTLDTVTGRGATTVNAITTGGQTVNTLSSSGGYILQQNGTLIAELRRVGNNNRSALYLWNNNTIEIELQTGGFSYFRTNGLAIGTATDAGYKLDVNGTTRLNSDTLVKGSASSGGTYNFQVQNSAGGLQMGVRADNYFVISGTLISASGTINVYDGNTILLSGGGTASTNKTSILVSHAWGPTTGTNAYSGITVQSTINQTGTATGISRGIYVNPVLTAAYDFRAIETVNGNVIFGSNSGNVAIGTSNFVGYKFDVAGTARVQNDLTVEGTATATIVKKQGGTATQFLKADGSVDNNSYATNDLSIAYAIALG